MSEESIEVKVAVMDNRLLRLEGAANKMEEAITLMARVSERQESNLERLTQLIDRVDKHEDAIESLLVSKAWLKGVLVVVSLLGTTVGGTAVVVLEVFLNSGGS